MKSTIDPDNHYGRLALSGRRNVDNWTHALKLIGPGLSGSEDCKQLFEMIHRWDSRRHVNFSCVFS